MLETTTKTRGHWAASWPATFDDATDVNWARDETAKKCFAFDLINVLIADAILPHAAERVRHRRSERIAAMLKRGSGADSNPPKKRKAKKLAKSKQHRQREPEHEAEKTDLESEHERTEAGQESQLQHVKSEFTVEPAVEVVDRVVGLQDEARFAVPVASPVQPLLCEECGETGPGRVDDKDEGDGMFYCLNCWAALDETEQKCGTELEKLRAMLDEEETLLQKQLATDDFLTPAEEEEAKARLSAIAAEKRILDKQVAAAQATAAPAVPLMETAGECDEDVLQEGVTIQDAEVHLQELFEEAAALQQKLGHGNLSVDEEAVLTARLAQIHRIQKRLQRAIESSQAGGSKHTTDVASSSTVVTKLVAPTGSDKDGDTANASATDMKQQLQAFGEEESMLEWRLASGRLSAEEAATVRLRLSHISRMRKRLVDNAGNFSSSGAQLSFDAPRVPNAETAAAALYSVGTRDSEQFETVGVSTMDTQHYSTVFDEQRQLVESSGRWAKAGAKIRVVSMLQSHREVDADFAEFLDEEEAGVNSSAVALAPAASSSASMLSTQSSVLATKPWGRLSAMEGIAATMLGFTPTSWPALPADGTIVQWHQMSMSERDAANTLGLTATSWPPNR
eukprot:COSAG05_NODE_1833_length_3998_cov_5.510900_2_plen_624_part_00